MGGGVECWVPLGIRRPAGVSAGAGAKSTSLGGGGRPRPLLAPCSLLLMMHRDSHLPITGKATCQRWRDTWVTQQGTRRPLCSRWNVSLSAVCGLCAHARKRVCVCTCTCACACASVCQCVSKLLGAVMCLCAHVCVYTCVRLCVHTHVYMLGACGCKRLLPRMHACVCVHAFVCKCVGVCVCDMCTYVFTPAEACMSVCIDMWVSPEVKPHPPATAHTSSELAWVAAGSGAGSLLSVPSASDGRGRSASRDI